MPKRSLARTRRFPTFTSSLAVPTEVYRKLCRGGMLLEALVACAGVTLKPIATALEIPLEGGTARAEGGLGFTGCWASTKLRRLASRR